ncbi:MAG: NUDIX hydrolase [Magnetococcales bacterium]|nr:NUDIX hydrolase [Magnetococcales bacterium]
MDSAFFRDGIAALLPQSAYRQSAVIPCRFFQGALQVCLVTSRSRRRWIVPKGIVEEGMTPAESAAKEALEEAGIAGEILPEVMGTYRYRKWGGVCEVECFVMIVEEVLDEWLEMDRDREWVDLDEAIERVEESRLREMLEELPLFLQERNV